MFVFSHLVFYLLYFVTYLVNPLSFDLKMHLFILHSFLRMHMEDLKFITLGVS